MKALHLEDNRIKHGKISREMRNAGVTEIHWVKSVESGLRKIEESIAAGEPYDLAITDMHYPIVDGGAAEWEAGSRFIERITDMQIELPIILCSSLNMNDVNIYGCVWYQENRDWETELRNLILSLQK